MGMGKPMGGQMPTQQQSGMGGKGGPKPMQSQPQMGTIGTGLAPQPQMGNIGGAFAPQQGTQPAQSGMGGKGGTQPRGTLVGIGPTDAGIYSNDPNAVPYTGPTQGGYLVNGVPGPAPQRPAYTGGMGGKGGTQPQQPQGGFGQQLADGRFVNQFGVQLPQAQGVSQEEAQRALQLAYERRSQLPQAQGVSPEEAQRAAQLAYERRSQSSLSMPGNVPQPAQPAFVQQPIQAEDPQQAMQRRIQQLVAGRRNGTIR